MSFTMHAVKSSNIANVGYDEAGKVLAVEFKNSGMYHYENVPFTTFDALLKAESVGKFFGEHVRPHFKHTKLEKEKS